MGNASSKWSDRELLDQTRTLHVTIDRMNYDGQTPTAVMISRTIQAIVRRCPSVAITLCFVRCRCDLAPVSGFETETFPRVTKLVIYVGKKGLEDSDNVSRANPCMPTSRFWRPLVNGETFPDCLDLEVRHHWARAPPSHATLDLRREAPRHDRYANYYSDSGAHLHSGSRRGMGGHMLYSGGHLGSTNGLKRFERIVMECPPELNSPLLMQLLGNPNAVASNLTTLELRFCTLSYETYSLLFYHAPPNLKSLVLLCCYDREIDYPTSNAKEIPHLCPLVREYSKKLVHFEFGASTICCDLFFDDADRRSLKHSGIATRLGRGDGATNEEAEGLDGHAIRETIQACRRQKRTRYRDDRIKEAINAACAKHTTENAPKSVFGNPGDMGAPVQLAGRVQRETEALLDEEEERRSRLIEGSKTPWFRRIIMYHGLCDPAYTWAEIQIAAEMEEKGIEWVLAGKLSLL